MRDDLFKLHWTYLENEVWLDSTAGWLAVVKGESQFAMVERFQYLKSWDDLGKTSLIFYKNGATLELNEKGSPVLRSSDLESAAYYMEADINSPMIELQPGESYALDTSWSPTRADSQMRGVTSAGVNLSPLTIAMPNNSLVLSGLFGRISSR